MLTDPIADMLTRIRNAVHRQKTVVNVRCSGVCAGVLQVLKEEGYIQDYAKVEDAKSGLLRVYLKYDPSGQSVLSAIQRVSKPGCRVYSNVDKLPRPMDGLGVAVVSTSRGVLSDRKCRQLKIGGEILCTVS